MYKMFQSQLQTGKKIVTIVKRPDVQYQYRPLKS